MIVDGTWRYVWNAENRLVEMRTYRSDNIPQNGDEKLSFAYDFMGRRYQKQVYVYNTSTSNFELQTLNLFIYDGWNLISEIEFNPQSEVVNRHCYTWGLDLTKTLQGAGGVGGLLSQTTFNTSSTNSYFAMADANGNISDYVDVSGNVAAHFEYDAFGRVTDETIAFGLDGSLFTHRFSSKYEDFETDLNYYGFRFYGAEMGRWLNRDPIGERGGVNENIFIGNHSLNFVDVLGLSETDCCDVDCDGLLNDVGDLYDMFQDLSESLGDLLEDQHDTLLTTFLLEQNENAINTLMGALVGGLAGNAWRAGTASNIGQGGRLGVDLARSGALTGPGLSNSSGFGVALGSGLSIFAGEQIVGIGDYVPQLYDTDAINDMLDDAVGNMDDFIDQLNDTLSDMRGTYRECCQ